MNSIVKNSSMEQQKTLAARHTGISFLKIFMAFLVVKSHFPDAGKTVAQKFIGRFTCAAVPCFMILSFYLAKDLFVRQDKLAFTARLKRLYAPVVLWNVFFYAVYSAQNIICRGGGYY